MFKTHLALGFLIGLFIIEFFNVPYKLLFLFLVTIFSGLPDIDHPKSTYGRKFRFLSFPISLISKHRGIFHSIFPPLIAFLLLKHYNYTFLGLAIVIGYITHLIGDSFTKQGINFLHPISTFEIRGPLTTGALVESLLFFVIIALDVFYSLKFIGLF